MGSVFSWPGSPVSSGFFLIRSCVESSESWTPCMYSFDSNVLYLIFWERTFSSSFQIGIWEKKIKKNVREDSVLSENKHKSDGAALTHSLMLLVQGHCHCPSVLSFLGWLSWGPQGPHHSGSWDGTAQGHRGSTFPPMVKLIKAERHSVRVSCHHWIYLC